MDNVIRKGYRYNKLGTKQLWFCTKCKLKFTRDDGFWKMKNTPETITEALDLYEVGHSLAETKNHMWKHHGIKISGTSIRNWVKKYSKKITNYTETLPVKVKERIHEDEVELRVRKKKKYFWRAKESKTGFKFSGPVGRRSMANCQRLNRQIKKRSYQHMLDRKKKHKKKIRFVSDKLAHYKTTHNKMFRNVTKITHGVPIKAKKAGLKYNNNEIECEHPAINLRIRQMKDVDDNDFAEAVLHLKDAMDNFTRKRNGNSKTPAELAGISLDLGRNKTLGLIYILRFLGPEEFIESDIANIFKVIENLNAKMSDKILPMKEIRKHVKKKTIDPYIYIPNFFCAYVVKLLLYTPITANHLSLILYLLYVPVSFLIAMNSNMILAIVLLHVALLIDCSDGVLARCKNQTSFLGEYFEYISHETIPAMLFFALSIYSFRILNSVVPLYLGGILIFSILVIISTGTSKERIIFSYIKKIHKLLPKLLHSGKLIRDSEGFTSMIFQVIQVLSSLGLLTLIITITYILNFLQYLIFFYTAYYLSIAILKFVYAIKIGFKPYGLK